MLMGVYFLKCTIVLPSFYNEVSEIGHKHVSNKTRYINLAKEFLYDLRVNSLTGRCLAEIRNLSGTC